MQASKRILAAAIVAAIGQSGLIAASHAATVTWDGGGGDSNLNNAINWVGDVLPAVGDSTVFTGAVRLDPIVNVPTQYLTLTFDVNAGAFVFGGTNQLTLGATPSTAGNLTNNAAQVETFNNPFATYGGTIRSALATSSLVFNGTFNAGNGGALAANSITFNGLGSTTLNGGLTSAYTATVGTLTKNEAGALFINGDNSAFAGRVFINGGTLRINNANALGSGGGAIETALSSGGTGTGALELAGADYTLNKPVVVRSRTNAEVAVRNVIGNHTVANVSTGSGGNTWNFDSTAGNLAIANINTTATTGNRIIRTTGDGNGEFQNWTPAVTSGSQNVLSLVKAGNGTWTYRSAFATNAGIARIGDITVSGGNLVLEPGVGQLVTGVTFTTTSFFVPNVSVATGATLTVKSADGTSGEVGSPADTTHPGTLVVNGTLDASTFSAYSLQVGQTLLGAGTIKTGGRLEAYGDNAIYIGNDTAAVAKAGTLSVQGNLFLTNQFGTTGGLRYDLAGVNTVGGGVNDLLSVAGDVQLDPGGVPIRVSLNPLTGALATGSYRLIDFTSGATLDPAAFILSGGAAGMSRQSFAIGTAPGQVNLNVSGAAANLVFKGNISSAWDIVGTANWLNGATADKYYQFDNVTFNDTSVTGTVDLQGTLTPGSITVNAAKDYTFSGSGLISGSTGLTKSGTGKLTIANTGVNDFTGAVTVNGGTIQIGIGGTEGNLTNGAITNNGTLIYNTSTARTPGLISGTGNVIVNGTGGVVFGAASTYTGTTTLNAGQSIVSNATGLGDASAGTTINTGATAYFTLAQTNAEPLNIAGEGPTAGNGAIRTGGNALTTFTGPVTLLASSTINNDGASTAVFNAPITGNGDLTKVGGGTTVLGADGNSWSGGTIVNGGILQVGAGAIASNLAAGPLTLTAGTLAFGSSQAVTFNRAVTGSATIAQGNGGGTTTLTGDLTGFTGTLAVLPLGAQPLTVPLTNSGTLIVSVPTGATVARVQDNGQGTGAGILRLTNSAALAPGALIEVLTQQNVGIGRLELGNNVSINAGAINLSQRNLFAGLTIKDLTPAISSTDGNNTLSGNIVASTGGTYAGLEAAAGSTFTVNGTVKPIATAASPRNLVLQGAGTGILNSVVSNDTAAINLNKIGSGTWTVNGANTYTGSNLLVAGTLVFGTDAQTPVFGATASGIDIQGGKAIFKYVAGNSPASNVQSILTAGFAQTPKFSTGTLRSTTLVAGHALGWRDVPASTQVEVAYTLPGDSNLDFSVDFSDLLALAQNYGTSGKVWSQGDSNYDTNVDFTDLLALAQNYGMAALTSSQSSIVGADFAGDFALAQALVSVPEPTTLGVLGLAAMTLVRRRRA